MAETVEGNNLLSHKFIGCLVGALVGDCLGSSFEFAGAGSKRVYVFFNNLRDPGFKPESKHRSGRLPYTDDTAQTKHLAKSLIEKGLVDTNDLGHRFTKEYHDDTNRGYGLHVTRIFKQLQQNPSSDVLEIAQEQFDGSGSYGNGAAMRVSPVALYYHENTQQMIEAASLSSQVTHAHRNGYRGAILQCLAIQKALAQDPTTTVEPIAFVRDLRAKMEEVEAFEEHKDYCEKLQTIEEYLKESSLPKMSSVIKTLGTDEPAVRSVPTAIFCYLAAQKPIEEIEADNEFERTLCYAISLGGDTDTIASMAGAICGAHVGFDGIPPHFIPHCEDIEGMINLAEKLHHSATKN